MANKKPERHLYLVRTPEPRSESKPARIHYTPTSGRDEHTRGSSALNHVDGQDYERLILVIKLQGEQLQVLELQLF